MDLEYEWYENIRNGLIPLCDRDYTPIHKEQFFNNQFKDRPFCDKCFNWVQLKVGTCENCKTTVSQRSFDLITTKPCPSCFNNIKLEVKT